MNLLPWPIIPAAKTAHAPTEGFQPQEGYEVLVEPIIPAAKTAHAPTEGFQPQEGYEVLVEPSDSHVSSPRLEHFGHLWALVPRSTGVGVGSRVREEIGE